MISPHSGTDHFRSTYVAGSPDYRKSVRYVAAGLKKGMARKKVEFFNASEKQQELIDAVLSQRYKRILFGGSVGSMKTWGGIACLVLLCKIFPGSRWAVMRTDRPTLLRNTLPSFWRIAPSNFFDYKDFNKGELVAFAKNGSRIDFIPESLEHDPELLRLSGLEVNGFLLEEGNELQEKTYLKAIERAGRWIVDPMPEPLILTTCNPHQGYLKDMFYNPWTENKLDEEELFIQSLTKDNPHLPASYLKSLEEIKKRAPSLYRRMVLGSWEAEDSLHQLVSWEFLHEAAQPSKPLLEVDSMGVDVGRFGPDPSVWTVLKKGNVAKKVKIDKTDSNDVAEVTEKLINEYDIPHHRVVMDTVGLGAGAFDICYKNKYYIQSFVGGASQLEQAEASGFSFFNLRTQAAWNLKLGIEDRKIGKLRDKKTLEDIAALEYDVKGDKKLWVWDKDTIKKKIHRSPDDGDSLMYAYWGSIYDTIEAMPGIA